MKRRFGLALITASLILASCATPTPPANKIEQNQVGDQQGIYNKNQPIHTYQFSAVRALMIQLYDLQVKGDLNTWSVVIANNGVPVFSCPSKGFPIPYSTQLTNPWQADRAPSYTGGAPVGVGQMEPTGVYTGQSMGTWVMCLDEKGSVHPQYFEPLVLAFTYPVAIKDGKIVVTGNATATLDIAAK